MYSIGIKIPKWNKGQLLLVDNLVRTYAETINVTDLMSTTRKICIKSFFVNYEAWSSFYEFYDTHGYYRSGLTAFGWT